MKYPTLRHSGNVLESSIFLVFKTSLDEDPGLQPSDSLTALLLQLLLLSGFICPPFQSHMALTKFLLSHIHK